MISSKGVMPLFLAAALTVFPPPVPGAPIDLSEILSLRTPRDVALSPDGSQVAFTVGWTDTASGRSMSEIRIAETGGTREPVVLVPASKGPWSPAFSPDGTTVAFFSVDGSGRQVWTVPVAGGSPGKLTKANPVRSFRWMPDGSGVVTLVESPGQARSSDPVIEGAPRPKLEFQFTALDGSIRRTLFRGDAGIDDWDIDSDGARIVFSSNGTGVPDHENRFDLYVATPADGSARRLTSRFGPETHPRFSPDGTVVAFQADQDTSVTFSQEEIFIVKTAGGAPVCLTAACDYPVTAPQWRPDGTAVVAELAGRATNSIVEIPLDGSFDPEGDWPDPNPDPKDRPEPSTYRAVLDYFWSSFDSGVALAADLRAFISEPSWSAGACAFVVVRSEDRSGLRRRGRAIKFGRAEGGRPPAYHQAPSINAITWISSDGTEIGGLLYGNGSRNLPTIVILHGGPYNRATARLGGSDTAVVLASRGYLVFMPNYRGSKGYGEAFGQALRGDPGRLELEDIHTGLDSLIARGLADPDRLGILGWSYGGYLVNMAIATSQRFRAAVSMYGMSSLENDFYFGESPSYELEYFGGAPWDKPDLYRERSPLTHVAGVRTPLLLLHGENDAKVSVMHAKAMWTALTTLDRTVELVRYPGEGHGFRQYGHKIDAARRTTAWFDTHLRK